MGVEVGLTVNLDYELKRDDAEHLQILKSILSIIKKWILIKIKEMCVFTARS